MSVIHDSQLGDELICIEAFHAAPDSQPFTWDCSRKFHVGEHVRYAGFRHNPNLADNPACWMVLFQTEDGTSYAATQTYFVTEEGWQGLKKYFARRLLREPKRRQAPRR